MSSAALRGSGIEASYGRRSVLRGVDIELRPGEIVALLGPNGAGKTTLMKVLVGLIKPAAGTVRGPATTQVGWVPQGGAVWQRLTVRENLELFARLTGLPGHAVDRARETADQAELSGWFDTTAGDLSGGLRQRLNVAVGLLGDPSHLVLDEPTTGVDLVHRAALHRLLRARASGGCSVLISTHSLEDAGIADRVLVLVEGRIAFDGTLEQIAQHAATDDAAPVTLEDRISAGLLQLWGAGASS